MAPHNATAPGIAAHIAVIDGTPTTTTQDIAEVYGKRHDHILRIVRQRMAEAPAEWRLPNFGETVIERPNPSGGEPIKSPVIRMTRKGFHFVVGKFTGAKAVAHQIAYADEFERMERALASARQQQQQRGGADAPGTALANNAQHPSIDARARLLGGQSDPPAGGYPANVDSAMQDAAWRLTREAHALVVAHLQRRIAHRHIHGHPVRRLDARAAVAELGRVTLGQCLAHEAYAHLNYATTCARLALTGAQHAVASLEDELARHQATSSAAHRGQA